MSVQPSTAVAESMPALLRLAPDLEVFHLNAGETHALYQEIFVEACHDRASVGLKAGDVVFDVGANIGFTTLFLHRRCPGLRFRCFEPLPPVAAVLEANLARFGVDAVVMPVAVSDKAGRVRFSWYPNNTVMSGLHTDEAADRAVSRRYLTNFGVDEDSIDYLLAKTFETQEIACDTVRLSDVIERDQVGRIDLLKIDVEKSERAVLQGIDAAHWPRIRRVALEVHDEDGGLAYVLALLQGHGFVCEVSRSPLLEGTSLYDVLALRS
jgi:FkbM family methyltransferase